ncbi:MAG: hypothetical protein JWP92_1572 [Caulobacter sp.]|nr:hypothetical protein [Caulobacter sp.]
MTIEFQACNARHNFVTRPLEPPLTATISVAVDATLATLRTGAQTRAMAIKALLTLAAVVAVSIGLLLPIPGTSHKPAAASAFDTIELAHR